MKRFSIAIGFALCVGTVSAAQVPAPYEISGKCKGEIFRAAQVVRPARLINFGDLVIPREAAEKNVRGQVVINAVLCRDGRVTNLEVVKGVPWGVTESALNKVRGTKFTPAELNFHSVSQALRFEFDVSGSGASTTLRTEFSAAEARLVEEVDFIGMRRLTKEELYKRIRTRAGEPYDPEQVNRDLQSILMSGNFDKAGTRVRAEDAARGGVRTIFEVAELPLISEIRFLNVTVADQARLVEGLRQFLDLRPGVVFDPPRLVTASRMIERFFHSKGSGDVKVETLIERPSESEAIVIFKISAAKIGP